MSQSARRRDPIPELKRQAGVELAVLLDGWNADDVAALIGTDRPRISELRRGKLARFSLETLIRYLTRLGRQVEIRVTAPPPRLARANHAPTTVTEGEPRHPEREPVAILPKAVLPGRAADVAAPHPAPKSFG